jgi:hypothetical protein
MFSPIKSARRVPQQLTTPRAQSPTSRAGLEAGLGLFAGILDVSKKDALAPIARQSKVDRSHKPSPRWVLPSMATAPVGTLPEKCPRFTDERPRRQGQKWRYLDCERPLALLHPISNKLRHLTTADCACCVQQNQTRTGSTVPSLTKMTPTRLGTPPTAARCLCASGISLACPQC